MKDDIETQIQPTDAVLSPYDGAVVGYMPIADADAVERSIERAQAAFEIMRQLPRFTRAEDERLDRAHRHAEDLGDLRIRAPLDLAEDDRRAL